jgi:hypothetical protein
MSKKPASDKKSERPPNEGELSHPKRGAIPTPRAEIEKAKPYIPEIASRENDPMEE